MRSNNQGAITGKTSSRLASEIVVGWRHDHEIRLGLGKFESGKRRLAAYRAAPFQGQYQQAVELLHRPAVRCPNRPHGDQRSLEQLDALVLENAERDQLVVLDAAQGTNDFSG